MNKRVLKELLNDLGNGKAHIIIHNVEDNINDFLFDALTKELQSIYPDCLIYPFEKANTKYDIIPILESISKINKGKRLIIIVENLTSFYVPESIINMFYGNHEIDLIVSTNISLEYYFNDHQKTLVAARYRIYFCPPMLYEDMSLIKSTSPHIGGLNGLKQSTYERGKQIYSYLLNHSGETLTYSKIKTDVDPKINLLTIIEIINYMVARGMIYLINRMDVDKLEVLDSKFVIYPTFISDLDFSTLNDETKYYLKLEASLVAKIFNEDDMVFYGISYHYEVHTKGRVRITYNNGFAVGNKYGQIKYIIKPSFQTDYRQEYNKTSLLTPVIIVSLGKGDIIKGNDGVKYCGIETFLDKEFEYERLS